MNIRYPAKHRALIWCSTALACLQLTAWGAVLTNRYSFNEASGSNVIDSVGGKNGYLNNTNLYGAGVASLANGSDVSSDGTNGFYVVLPPALLTPYTNVTLETWVTPTAPSDAGFWARVWDFGDSDGTAGQVAFLYERFGGTGLGVEADSYIAVLGGDNFNFATTPMVGFAENHLVWTASGDTHVAKLYLNGTLLSTIYNFNNSPNLAGPVTNSWLGRSQFSADPLANADFNEFRVYNGALNALEVAADYQNGADTYPASYGTVNSIQLVIASPLPKGSSHSAQVFANASGLTNSAVDIGDSHIVTYVSGNTNIVTVDANGLVTAVGAGTTTVVANYLSLSSTQSVTAIVLPTTIIDRYSFSEAPGDSVVHDSVGHKNGTLFSLGGAATFSGDGRALLDGVAGDYIDLGPGVIDPTNITTGAVTLEVWATTYPVNGAWTRLFDFGTNNTSTGNGANYIFFAPNTAGNGGNSRLAVSDADPGFNGEDGFNLNNYLGRTNLHVVAVFNPNPNRKFLGLYVNGAFVASITTTKTFAAIHNAVSFVGRSTYGGDSPFNGEFTEFRVYNGELDRFQIAASDQAGPDRTNFALGTFTSFNIGVPTNAIALSGAGTFTAIMNFSAVTNVSVIGDPNLTVTSSDTNVFSVNNNGTILGNNVGTATLNASYNYIVGVTTNTYTGSASVTVVRDNPAHLIHRYSFNDGTANDSVGTANGTLVGGAAVANGVVAITNPPGVVATEYLQLPAGVVTNLQAVTIEAWASIGSLSANGWANLFDFGTQDASVNDAFSIDVCLHSGTGATGNLIEAISDTDNANVHNQQANAGANSGLDNRSNVHVVAVYDPPAGYMSIYTNGVLAAINTALTIQLSSIQDVRNVIGADNWPDAGMVGTIDEFRIYSGVLHADEIRANQALGPNTLASTNTPVALTITPSGPNQVLITWPAAATGLTLQSTSSLSAGGWATAPGANPVVVGSNWQVTLPTTGTAQFFRLAH